MFYAEEQQLRNYIEQLEKALAFYANHFNWKANADGRSQLELCVEPNTGLAQPRAGWEVAEHALKGTRR